MNFHNTNPNVDKVTELRSQVDDVQQTLVRNIGKFRIYIAKLHLH